MQSCYGALEPQPILYKKSTLGASAVRNTREIAGMNSGKIAGVLAYSWFGCEVHALIISFQYSWEKKTELQFA